MIEKTDRSKDVSVSVYGKGSASDPIYDEFYVVLRQGTNSIEIKCENRNTATDYAKLLNLILENTKH